MKKTLLTLALALGLVALAKADVFYGWDGPCEVYFHPGYGYYEMCDSYPFFLGTSWGTWGWRYGFNRTNTWFGNNRWDWRRRWQGNQWHGNNWQRGNWNGNRNWHNQNFHGGQFHGGQNFHGGTFHGAGPRPSGHGHGSHPHGH